MNVRRWVVLLAGGLLVAGLSIAPDITVAKGGGGGGGGHGHGGGGRGGIGHFSRSGGAAHFSRARSSFSRSGGQHRSVASQRRSTRLSKSYFAARRNKGTTAHALGKQKAGGVASNALKSNQSRKQNLKQLTSNKSLKQATLAKHNAFFDKKLAAKNGLDGSRRDHGRWRDRNGRWYGYRWYGGVFWPYAFGDYFSYALWPDDYYDTFWGYGPDAILWGSFYPYGEFADGDTGYGPALSGDIYRPYRNRRRAASTGQQADSSNVADTCGSFAPGVSDLPIPRLEQIIDATEDQRSALQELKDAAAKASETLKQSCASDTPLTPVARLDAIQRRLQAMEEANETVRGPLIRLYGLLTDQQKQKLQAAAEPRRRSRAQGSSADLNIGELCSSQAEFTSVPAEQIQSTVNLDDSQKQELEKLKAASVQASDLLKSSCPATIPNTLDSRLDAAQKRVTTLIQAIDTVRPAVRDFFASLSDEQKAALNLQTQGEPAASANNRG